MRELIYREKGSLNIVLFTDLELFTQYDECQSIIVNELVRLTYQKEDAIEL